VILPELILRLRLKTTLYGERVFGLRSLYDLERQEGAAIPALFVLPPVTTGLPVPHPNDDGPSRGFMVETYPVLVYLTPFVISESGERFLDERGEEAILSLSAHQDDLENALHGWQPRPNYGSMVPGPGTVVDGSPARFLYQFDFVVARQLSRCAVCAEDQEEWNEKYGGLDIKKLSRIVISQVSTGLPGGSAIQTGMDIRLAMEKTDGC
jgi:hypothetical protein